VDLVQIKAFGESLGFLGSSRDGALSAVRLETSRGMWRLV
jgi:hypothetical protein